MIFFVLFVPTSNECNLGDGNGEYWSFLRRGIGLVHFMVQGKQKRENIEPSYYSPLLETQIAQAMKE